MNLIIKLGSFSPFSSSLNVGKREKFEFQKFPNINSPKESSDYDVKKFVHSTRNLCLYIAFILFLLVSKSDQFCRSDISGSNHNCARLFSGNIRCWGFNINGELGYEDTMTRGDEVGEMGSSLFNVDLNSAVPIQITSSFLLLITSCQILIYFNNLNLYRWVQQLCYY